MFKNKYYLIFLSLLLQGLGVTFSKYASITIINFNFFEIFKNSFFLLSVILLISQTLVWQMVLRYFNLFWAYLFFSGNYIVILLISYFVFKENISKANIIGALFIIIGIIILNIKFPKENV
jgi:multidrug transporter EmrE-like cation transporter